MVSVKARVRNGRLVLDEATDLPEGTVVELVAVMRDGEDDLTDRDRRALHASLARAASDVDAGRLIQGDEVIERLRVGRG